MKYQWMWIKFSVPLQSISFHTAAPILSPLLICQKAMTALQLTSVLSLLWFFPGEEMSCNKWGSPFLEDHI